AAPRRAPAVGTPVRAHAPGRPRHAQGSGQRGLGVRPREPRARAAHRGAESARELRRPADGERANGRLHALAHDARGAEPGHRPHPRDAGRSARPDRVRVVAADRDDPRRDDRLGRARGVRGRPRGEPPLRAMTIDPALDLALRAALSLLLVAAAIHKLRDVRTFRATLAEYRLLPAPTVTVVAAGIAAAELALAVGLHIAPREAL